MQFKFLGILMGVAVRTKKPLDLHLAPLVWKQLCCIPLTLEDLEEVDLLYVQTLNSILHIEDSGITEENFHEVHKAPNPASGRIFLGASSAWTALRLLSPSVASMEPREPLRGSRASLGGPGEAGQSTRGSREHTVGRN